MDTPWEDFYTPVDFYGQAWNIAKKYAKKNPGADRELIYAAATEAAELYELIEKLRTGFKFRTWCYLRIKTALYIAERKEGNELTSELKAAIISDYESGMKAREIAEKHDLDCHVLRNNLARWKKSGAIRSSPEAAASSRTPAPKEKETPPLDKTNEGTNQNLYISSIPQNQENVKTLNYIGVAEAMRKFADEYFRSAFGAVEPVCIHAYGEGGWYATYTFIAGGKRYEISIREGAAVNAQTDV